MKAKRFVSEPVSVFTWVNHWECFYLADEADLRGKEKVAECVD